LGRVEQSWVESRAELGRVEQSWVESKAELGRVERRAKLNKRVVRQLS
jgi:hypothetical protein